MASELDLPKTIHAQVPRGTRAAWWIITKACFPLTVLIFLYPLYLVMEVEHPFAHAFGHGDLLLLAMLLMLETALEYHHSKDGAGWRLQTRRGVALIGAIIFTLLFAWTKMDIIALLPKTEAAVRHFRMSIYAQANVLCVLIAVGYGLYVYYAACAIEDEALLERAEQ
jgi:hypothetical protein